MNLGWLGEGRMFRKPSNLQIGIFMALFGIIVMCLVGVIFITNSYEANQPFGPTYGSTNWQVATYIELTSTEIAQIDQRLTLTAKIQTIVNHIDQSNTAMAKTQTREATPKPPQN